MTKRSRLASAVFVSGFGLLSACNNVGSPSAPAAPTTPVNGARPWWATPGNLVGHVGAAERIDIQVHLQMRNETQAEAELAAISDPDSDRFGQFLSDEEYDARYAPTAEDVAAVVAHLEANGLTVDRIPANKSYIAAAGSAAQIESAFATKLGTFNVAGQIKRAPVDAAVLPATLGSRVSTVLGLSTGMKFAPKTVKVGGIRPSAVWHKLHPNDTAPANTCSEWFGQIANHEDPAYPGYSPLTYSVCGYRPNQVRAAYGLSDSIRRGTDGKGQSIAIVDAYLSPTLLLDAQTYAANNDSDYPLKTTQLTTQMAPGTPSDPDTGWYGEQTLDVEAAHAIAPGAKIVYVGAQSATDKDLIAAINLIVEKKLASVVSNSYGSIEQLGGNFIGWHAIATQAGLKGVGIYFSSGDYGDEADRIGIASTDFPASLDNVTAVGGTSLAIGRTGEIAWELGWETSASFLVDAVKDESGTITTPAYWDPAPPGLYFFGSGGGTSYIYEQPKWQKGVVPDVVANVPGTPARAIPDVAMLADPFTGFKVGQTDPATNVYSEYAIGGTSLACPLFAATMAVAQQNAGKKFGFANPLFYKKRATAFRDITPSKDPQALSLPGGIVVVIDYPNLTIKTATGWDNVTGLGVPNGKDFLKAIK